MSTPGSLSKALNLRALRRLAGDRSFERGEQYFAEGRVEDLAEHGQRVTATVAGTEPYTVKLWADEGELGFSCTCPVGAEGTFCKHGVAVGLAWLDPARAGGGKSGKARPTLSMDDVRDWLSRQQPEALADLLVRHALDDDRLRQRLLMAAARSSPQGVDLATYRAAIDGAMRVRGFVDYRGASAFARKVDSAVDGLEDLLKAGHAAAVVELAEHALRRVERALQSVDDSDGNLGEILGRLRELHLQACRQARPDPEALASRLFEWELDSEWETFIDASESHAEVLGAKGLAVYRKLAEERWAHVPALEPGRDDRRKYGERFRITRVMETLARLTGNVEALVDVRKRDLSSAWGFLRIAETYAAAGQHDLALEWAERGRRAFPERTDSRLLEFLADQYHQRERHAEALALVWQRFEDSPHLESCQSLKAHAARTKAWPEWRDKALAHLRLLADRAAAKHAVATSATGAGRRAAARPWGSRLGLADRSEVVRVLLWEGDVEAAWSEAKEGGCTDDLWFELASRRERQHPEDALPIFQARIEPTLDGKTNRAYATAIELLRRIRGVLVRLGRAPEFVRCVESVRATHRAKRNFMKLLDREGWDARGAASAT